MKFDTISYRPPNGQAKDCQTTFSLPVRARITALAGPKSNYWLLAPDDIIVFSLSQPSGNDDVLATDASNVLPAGARIWAVWEHSTHTLFELREMLSRSGESANPMADRVEQSLGARFAYRQAVGAKSSPVPGYLP